MFDFTEDSTSFEEFWEKEAAQCPVPSQFADNEDSSDEPETQTPEKEGVKNFTLQTSNYESLNSPWDSLHSASFVDVPPPPIRYSHQQIIVSDNIARRRKLLDTSSSDSGQSSIPPCPRKRARKISQILSADASTAFFHTTISSISSFSPTFGDTEYSSQTTEYFYQRNLSQTSATIFDYGSYLCSPEDSIMTYEILRQREISMDAIKEKFLQQLSYSMPNVGRIRNAALVKVRMAVDSLNYSVETFHLAAYFLDVALSAMIPRVEETIMKMAATALVLASKMEEYKPLQFSCVSGGGSQMITKVSMSELAKFEFPMLTALKWRLEVATPHTFANFLHTVVRSSKNQIEFTKYLLAIFLLDHRCREWKSYLIAHATLIVSHILLPTSKTKYYNNADKLHVVVEQLYRVTTLRLDSVREICLHLIDVYEKAKSPCELDVHAISKSDLPFLVQPDLYRILHVKQLLKTTPSFPNFTFKLGCQPIQDVSRSDCFSTTFSQYNLSYNSGNHCDQVDMDQTSELVADSTYSFQDPFDDF